MNIQTPYLDGIRAISGATPSEKYRWIAKLIKERISECNSLEEIVESEKIPRILVPLIQVQAAQMLIKNEPNNLDNYAAIAEALKSEDASVVNKALQASSFFDGSNTTITNVRYFFDHLFPYVSLNTRIRIIKTLAIRLAPKRSTLAEEFFTAVATTYGLDQALPLLPACSETFMYNAILERRIVLSRKLVDTIFRKNPDFIVRYFRLSKPETDPYVRNLHRVNIYDFGDFLAALIKKRLKSFVELYEMHEKLPPAVRLSNKGAENFLKNGKEYFQRKPKLYIKLVPLKLITAKRMETIYSKLFPSSIKEFCTDQMLDYLEYYPHDRKLDLLVKSYREAYGRNILDDWQSVTVQVMRMLPAEERIKQARIKMEKESSPASTVDYTHVWRCYLSTSETIPMIKEEVSKTSEMENRASLLCQMIYSCRVNKDDQALLEALTYFRDRFKNEQPWFLLKVFECLLNLYDLPHLSRNHWAVLMDIIVRAIVKNDFMTSSTISEKVLESAIHFKIIYDEPIDQFIRALVELKSNRYSGFWNILTKYPEYERTCLEACLTVVSQCYNSNEPPWNTDRDRMLYTLCSSLYNFNETHVNHKHNARVERMSIKNYPWLLKKVERVLTTKDQSTYVLGEFRSILEKHEKDLFDRLFAEEKKSIADIESGEALGLLKKNPEEILSKWKEYLKACMGTWSRESTRRFVRATRWYNDIPARFVEQCLENLTKNKSGVSLEIVAVLVHGKTFTKIIEPLIPTKKTIDVHNDDAKKNYSLIYDIVSSVKYVNPPVSLQLIGNLCEGDYLSLALSALTNVCRRTALMDAIAFAKTLIAQRVTVRKHGIRLMRMLAPRDQLHSFLVSLCRTEEHHSIREVLFDKGIELFREEPGPATWSLLSQMASTVTAKDKGSFSVLIRTIYLIPDEYIVDFVKLLLRTIDSFTEAGVERETVSTYVKALLTQINAAVCNLLPEEFTEELLRRFLFNSNMSVSRAAGHFVLEAHLLPAKEKLDSRLKTFSTIFAEVVKNGWNVPHSKRTHFYPVNHAVHSFVDYLIRMIPYVDVDPRLIDGILKAFLSVLTPQMDATSYLMLVYTREQVSVKTPQEFGTKLGEKLPDLVDTFSPMFLSFMSNTMQYLFNQNLFKDYDKEDATLGVIEGLIENGSIEATLMAVKMLTPSKSKENLARYDKLVTKFADYDHPAIRSLLCDIINKTGYDDISDM
ncbi:uncharacterized protein LOC122404542 [Colletes gigas]|uniref:uncharacterized protein LOC122404542 n=1 Tax=Colletes gigas TaxID=935657 RepID=UPI001C9B4D0D|nr:uncharacterized protein LOC122404542 [Colletes gigas]